MNKNDTQKGTFTYSLNEYDIQEDTINLSGTTISNSDHNGHITFNTNSIPITTTTSDWTTSTITVTGGTGINAINSTDAYSTHTTWIYDDQSNELKLLRDDLNKEEELREKYSFLKEIWNEYQLILKMLQDEECDKCFKVLNKGI